MSLYHACQTENLMSVWAEILLFIFLVLIMDRIIGIQHTLAKIGSRLEEAIGDREQRESDSDIANELEN